MIYNQDFLVNKPTTNTKSKFISFLPLNLHRIVTIEHQLLKQLSRPLSREQLAENTDLDFTQLQITLTKLEMKGLASESNGKWLADRN